MGENHPKKIWSRKNYKSRRKQVVSNMNLTLRTCPVIQLCPIPLQLHAVAKPGDNDVHLERRIHAGRKTNVSP